MQIEKDGNTVLINASNEESEVIKQALVCFFNLKKNKAISTPESELAELEKLKADKKIAFRLYMQFPEPQIEDSH